MSGPGERESRRPVLENELISAYTSAETLNAAARYVSARALGEEFLWVRSRKCLERRLRGRKEGILLNSSYRNRPNKSIDIWVESLLVTEDEVGAWRARHPDLTYSRPRELEGIVCSASYLDLCHRLEEYQVDLAVSGERRARLERLARHVRNIALPWLESTSEVEFLSETVPAQMLLDSAVDLVEYAVSRGHMDQAAMLLERARAIRTSDSDFAEGRALAERGEKPPWKSPQSLGWTASRLGLI